MKRPEAWHDAYTHIFNTYHAVVLTVKQAAEVTNCSTRADCGVTAKYPCGWSGKAKGKTIRIDTLLDQVFVLY